MDRLALPVKEHYVEDDNLILELIKRKSEHGGQEINLDGNDPEDALLMNRFAYLARDLLLCGKGTVFCRTCGKSIPVKELIVKRSSPLDAHKGIDRKQLKNLKKELGLKGKMRLPGTGWTVISCNEGHELFRTMDWIS